MKKTLLSFLLSVVIVVTYATSAIPFVLAVNGEETPTVPDDSEYGKYQGTYLNLDFDSADDLNGAVGTINRSEGGFAETVEDGSLKMYATEGYDATLTVNRTLRIPVKDIKIDTTKPFTVSMRLKISPNAPTGLWYNVGYVSTSSSHTLGVITNAGVLQASEYGATATSVNCLKDGEFHTIDILYTPTETVGKFNISLYLDGATVTLSDTVKNRVLTDLTFNGNPAEEERYVEFKFQNYGAAYDHENAPAIMVLDYFRIGDATPVHGKYKGTYMDLDFDDGKLPTGRYVNTTNTTAGYSYSNGNLVLTKGSATGHAAFTVAISGSYPITIDRNKPIALSYRFMMPQENDPPVTSTYIDVMSDITGSKLAGINYAGQQNFNGTGTNLGGVKLKDGKFHEVDVLYTPGTQGANYTAKIYLDGELRYDTATGSLTAINDAVKAMTFTKDSMTYFQLMLRNFGTNENSSVTFDYIRLGDGTEFHDCSQNLTEHKAAAPDCSTSGNIAHYSCICGKLYSDASAKVETTLSAIVIPATGDHVDSDGNGACDICDTPVAMRPSYTVNLGTTYVEVVEGNQVTVTVSVDNVFASGEIKLTYNAEAFTFVGTSLGERAKAKAENGIVVVEFFGCNDKTAVEFYFTANDVSEDITNAEITLIGAALGDASTADTEDLTVASLGNKTVQINVFALPEVQIITIPAGFLDEHGQSGEITVTIGKSVKFKPSADYLKRYTVQKVTQEMGPDGQLELIADSDGWYSTSTSGEIYVESVTNSYSVINNGDLLEDKATYCEDCLLPIPYLAPSGLTPGMKYTVASVTIDGIDYTGYQVDGLSITIPGKDIIGNIVVTYHTEEIAPDVWSVQVNGSGAAAAEGYVTSVVKGAAYTLTLMPAPSGYKYDVSVTVNGEKRDFDVRTETTFILNEVNGDVIITVEKLVHAAISIFDNGDDEQIYVRLADSKMLYLVVNRVAWKEGIVYTYNGIEMLWSNEYQAYCVLVSALSASNAIKGEVAVMKGVTVRVNGSADVNMTGVIDANDAQLVYNMYNTIYDGFNDVVTMEKFLRADVNGDGILNTSDASAIIDEILKK